MRHLIHLKEWRTIGSPMLILQQIRARMRHPRSQDSRWQHCTTPPMVKIGLTRQIGYHPLPHNVHGMESLAMIMVISKRCNLVSVQIEN